MYVPGMPEKWEYGGIMVSGGTTELGAMEQQSLSTDLRPYLILTFLIRW